MYSSDYLGRVIDNHKKAFAKKLEEEKVEVMLCHGMMPAFIHGSSIDCCLWASYLLIWRVLCFCAGTIPVIEVKQSEQHYESTHNGRLEESVKQNMAGS